MYKNKKGEDKNTPSVVLHEKNLDQPIVRLSVSKPICRLFYILLLTLYRQCYWH